MDDYFEEREEAKISIIGWNGRETRGSKMGYTRHYNNRSIKIIYSSQPHNSYTYRFHR